VEDKLYVQEHLNSFSQHQEEGCQKEIVKQNGCSLAPVLRIAIKTNVSSNGMATSM